MSCSRTANQKGCCGIVFKVCILLKNKPTLTPIAEKIWIGPNYSNRRIFVLGESWYGDYTDDLATDDGYIRAYLEGHQPDPMYTRMANACMGDNSLRARRDYWHSLAFTNFVQCVGGNRADRPTTDMLKAAGPRLAALLELHRPAGV